MAIGGRPTAEGRDGRMGRRALFAMTCLVAAVVADATPVSSARIDQREYWRSMELRFAENVARPDASVPWPDVVDALRRAGGVSEVDQSPSGANFAHHAAQCIANSPGIVNPHRIPPDHPCGEGVDQRAARIGAANSAISLRSEPHTARQIIEGLAARPFHSMALLDPRVDVIDFASAFRPLSSVERRRFVAATWLSSTRPTPARPTSSVIMWPAPGWPVSGTFTITEEWPSPLWPCDVEISGPPIWMAVPSLGRAPRLDTLRLTAGDSSIDRFCVYSSDGFVGDDAAAVEVGRRAMDRHSAVVIVPLEPLDDGEYVLSGRLEGRSFRRSITVDSSP